MTMNTMKILLASSFALVATGAFADAAEPGISEWSTFSDSTSRAQVVAEMREATRLGLIPAGEGDIPVATAEQEQLIAAARRDVEPQLAKSESDVEG
jgi:hypothetical protein